MTEIINHPFELTIKCETREEVATYLKAPNFRNALYQFSYNIGRALRKGYHPTAHKELTEEESRMLEEFNKAFESVLEESDVSYTDLDN